MNLFAAILLVLAGVLVVSAIAGLGIALTAKTKNIKKSNRQIEELNKLLEAKKDEIDSILYVTSHDLRSPLLNVKGFSRELGIFCEQLTAERDALSEKLKKESLDIPATVAQITENMEKLDSMLKGVLQLSWLGRAILKSEPIDAEAILKSAIENYRRQIETANISVNLKSVPPCIARFSAMSSKTLSNIPAIALMQN